MVLYITARAEAVAKVESAGFEEVDRAKWLTEQAFSIHVIEIKKQVHGIFSIVFSFAEPVV